MISNVRSSKVIQSKAQVELLRRISLFEHLDDIALLGLARRMTVKRWHESAMIVAQGEPGTALHILFRGRARRVLFGDNGREMTLATLTPGDFFGETAILDGDPAPANVVAAADCVIFMLDRAVLLDALAAHPAMMMSLLSVMATQLRRSSALVGDLALHDVVSRLTRALIAIGEAQGEYREDGVMIPYRPTQQELANRVGTCRETVSRALSSMARRGLVLSQGRSLLLRNELLDRVREAA